MDSAPRAVGEHEISAGQPRASRARARIMRARARGVFDEVGQPLHKLAPVRRRDRRKKVDVPPCFRHVGHAGNDAYNREISARLATESMALVKVSDRGRGLPRDAIDRIFDPFYTTRAQGTGLGLAVVASTVAKHGGTVHAGNREDGGAEFTILLPVNAGRETKKEWAA